MHNDENKERGGDYNIAVENFRASVFFQGRHLREDAELVVGGKSRIDIA